MKQNNGQVDLKERMARLRNLKEKYAVQTSNTPKEQKQIVERLVKEQGTNIRTEGKIRREEKAIRRQNDINIRDKGFKPAGEALNKVVKALKGAGSARFSRTMLSYANAFGGNQQQNSGSQRPVGRPQGSLKHRSPFNEAPIPAVEFYKQMRQFRRVQTQKAEQIQEQRQRQFAQRGVQPNQISQVQDQQLRRQFEMQRQQMAMQQRQNIPPQFQRPQINPNQPMRNGQVIPRGTNIWKFRRGVVGQEGGLMGSPVQKVYGLPESFFN